MERLTKAEREHYRVYPDPQTGNWAARCPDCGEHFVSTDDILLQAGVVSRVKEHQEEKHQRSVAVRAVLRLEWHGGWGYEVLVNGEPSPPGVLAPEVAVGVLATELYKLSGMRSRLTANATREEQAFEREVINRIHTERAEVMLRDARTAEGNRLVSIGEVR